ncbi:Hypothetical protein POVR1_LOCUS280 [uncultured virus]|nr:Hypothetical protein POVR1_LOCUS280 [uncultured virus]
MDDPEVTIASPFDLREILIQLLLHADRKDYQKLYQSNKELMDSPFFLKRLQEHYYLPIQPLSFYDFVFERDIRDPVDRKNLCMTPKRMLIYAVKSNDPALVRSLLDDGAPTIDLTYFLAGEMGNPKILDQLVYRNTASNNNYLRRILEGLAYGSHNQLLKVYLQIDPTVEPESIARAAAKGGNLTLIRELYSPKTRSMVINGATAGGHPEIVEWIFKQAPQDPTDNTQIYYGAIENGNMELVDRSRRMEKMGTNFNVIIDNVIKSNNPKIVDWILSALSQRDLDEIYDASLKEHSDRMTASKIVKRILERYDELSFIANYLGLIPGGNYYREIRLTTSHDEIERTPLLIRSRLGKGSVSNIDPDVKNFLDGIFLQDFVSLTIPEIIRTAEETYEINHKIPKALKDAYNKKWISALKTSIKVDDLKLTKWIIDRFHPDVGLARLFAKDSQGCTAKWILKTF